MKRFGKLFLVFTLLIFTFPVYAAPIKIVASFSILGDLVQQVGGDNVDVTTLVGADGDVHVYQPTPADIRSLARADLVIINGLGFEGWMDRLIKASGYKGNITVASDGVTKIMADDRNADPHAWQNLKNGEIYVTNIAAGLRQIDPKHAALYRKNAENLMRDLENMDRRIKQQMAAVPAGKRSVITSHNAFGYFAAAYGVTFLAPVGLSTDAEPDAATLKKLVEMIRSGKTRAVFLENMDDAKTINQLSHETGITLGGKLYTDALSPADGPAPTYQKMFSYNVAQLLAAMRTNRE